MNDGLRNVATRMEAARERFADSVVEQFGFSRTEAGVILAAFISAKLVKLDAVGGVYNLTTGAAWDESVMRRALAVK